MCDILYQYMCECISATYCISMCVTYCISICVKDCISTCLYQYMCDWLYQYMCDCISICVAYCISICMTVFRKRSMRSCWRLCRVRTECGHTVGRPTNGGWTLLAEDHCSHSDIPLVRVHSQWYPTVQSAITSDIPLVGVQPQWYPTGQSAITVTSHWSGCIHSDIPLFRVQSPVTSH